MGRKLGAVPFEGGAGSPSNTMLPGARPTSAPDRILIDRKLEGSVPFFAGKELGPHLAQSRLGRGLPPYQVAS